MDSCDEFTCPICLDSFKDPVTIDCGHNFCHACLTQYCRACGKDIPCPQCREIVQQRNFRPNRQLANVIETVKRLQKNKQGVCAKHQVPLNLFCKEDAALVCLVCDRTRQHKHHVVVPAEDVATEYKEKIKACLKSLEKSSEAFISRRMTEDLRSSQYLKQLEVEKQKISCAFEPIQNLLEERKSLLLDHVVNLEKEIKETRETDLARLSGKITHLGNLITEMERKLQQPANEFLQDIKGTLLRSEEKQEVCHTSDLTPFWEDRLILYSQKTSALERALKKCQDSIEYALDKAQAHRDQAESCRQSCHCQCQQ
ncbi:zinc finger protein RFP-like [Zootoca vivipara]|uniref:zinc finger protein RFP-like n=1 Tax=Zootoca vivipara TaxID=8524 RepID=UPI00293C0428|nr:zinc finger protein RFP-like [Zootoca vivipara]